MLRRVKLTGNVIESMKDLKNISIYLDKTADNLHEHKKFKSQEIGIFYNLTNLGYFELNKSSVLRYLILSPYRKGKKQV